MKDIVFIYLLMCYDRVRPPDDSTDEGSLSRPQRIVQSSSLQQAAVFKQVEMQNIQMAVLETDNSLLSVSKCSS